LDTLEVTPENLPYVSQIHPCHAKICTSLLQHIPVHAFEQGLACINDIPPLILASALDSLLLIASVQELLLYW
jgi:hypothetical protein